MRIALIALSLALAACDNQDAGTNEAASALRQSGDVGQDEMRAAYNGLAQAFAGGDSLAIMTHYAPGAVILDAGHLQPTTDRQLQTQWTAQFTTLHPADYVTSDLHLQPLGPDAFVATGISSFTADVGSGRGVLRVRFSHAFRRQADGKWLVVAEHISMPPPGSPLSAK